MLYVYMFFCELENFKWLKNPDNSRGYMPGLDNASINMMHVIAVAIATQKIPYIQKPHLPHNHMSNAHKKYDDNLINDWEKYWNFDQIPYSIKYKNITIRHGVLKPELDSHAITDWKNVYRIPCDGTNDYAYKVKFSAQYVRGDFNFMLFFGS